MVHNWPINCLFAAELLLGFGTISQGLSQWSDTPLFLHPFLCFLSSIFLPVACVYVLRQRAAVSSSSFRREMESSSAKSHHCSPATIGRRGVLGYHDDHIKLVKVIPIKPRSFGVFFKLYFTLFLFLSMIILIC